MMAMRVLLDHAGTAINALSAQHNTPLYMAASVGHCDVVKALPGIRSRKVVEQLLKTGFGIRRPIKHFRDDPPPAFFFDGFTCDAAALVGVGRLRKIV